MGIYHIGFGAKPELSDAVQSRLLMPVAKTIPPIPAAGAEIRLLNHLLRSVIAAAQPAHLVARNLPQAPLGRTIVIGAGKASGAMARALDEHWPGPLEGAVVIPRGSHLHPGRIQLLEASHPVPDAASVLAADQTIELVRSAGPDDLVLALVSGGGSSLLCRPAAGVTLADKQALNDALLASGATISEINTVRKHLSSIKGGRLVPPDCRASIVALLMSDVPGDDPSVIASGPTVPDSSTLADARAVLDRCRITPPEAVRRALLDPGNETPKPDDPRFSRVENRIILTPHSALSAALPIAREAGYDVQYLGDDIEGDSAVIARHHARLALEIRRSGRRAAIISGGETGVQTRGVAGARGGRNSHYALALALALDGASGIHAIAADTDGIDGKGGHAGAIVTPDTLVRAKGAGVDARRLLDETNSYAFFEVIGDLVITGPTETNVNDFRAILIDP
jgi:glycerate 2-kinase